MKGARGVTVVPLRPEPAEKTVFVLGGGGNLGAIQVGMLRALIEQGIVPDEILGCSVGALNAAAIATDPSPYGVAVLERLWLDMDAESIIPSGRLSALLLLTRKGRSLHHNGGLRHAIETTMPVRRFEDFPVPFSVVATSLATGRERWFSSGDIVEPILASAALPAVFPPVEIDGELFIDGAVVDNVPIARAVDVGATRIYVLHVGNFDRPRREPKRPLDVLLHSFSIARSYRFAQDVKAVPPGIELVILPGIDPGPIRYNDFSRSKTLIERAYVTTTNFLRDPVIAATS